MNRLVLIGNGFDLAHGMKTSYNDFLLWYLKKCFRTADFSSSYVDELIEIACPSMNMQGLGRPGTGNTEELFDELYQNNELYEFLTGQLAKGKGYQRYDTNYTVALHSEFFQKLLEKCTKATWVEIENEFYHELKRCLNLDDLRDQESRLGTLNQNLKHLISQLEEYLLTLPPVNKIPGYSDLLSDPIRPQDLLNTTGTQEIHRVNTLLLNFNYTSTAEHYLQAKYNLHTGQTYDINYIHGKAGDKDNPMVFGFGDELDEDYAKMEKSKTKGFLKHIKSFWYLRTQNYHNLIRFLQAEDFQVYTLGHSCSLSDRTLLNMIFEHQNCKSIKVFYHGNKQENNFISLTEEISRHFRDKTAMRNKIISLAVSSPMPQHDSL